MSDYQAPDGAYPILLTAFDESGALDLPAISSLLDFYQRLGVPGLLALGQASELLYLDDDERLRVAQHVADHPTGDMTIATVGNFGATLPEQAECLRRIYEMGSDLAVVALSLLPGADNLGEQLLELSSLVGAHVRLGIYELPQPEHRLLSPEEVGTAAASGRFYFMKDTCREIAPFSAKVKAAAGSVLKLFQANLSVLPPSMEAGSHGFCGWLPMVCPELSAQVCDMSLPAELRKAAHDRLMAFNEVMIAHGFPASAKHILARRGVAIQAYSRAESARRFFEAGPAALDQYIAENAPFAALALAGTR
ncbi:MAG: dihydrodipicolinate synthase family protein [Chloroflexota bacterium]|nr:dihydrodipicolinate synthase family protein [Chloroflexota bacterium]